MVTIWKDNLSFVFITICTGASLERSEKCSEQLPFEMFSAWTSGWRYWRSWKWQAMNQDLWLEGPAVGDFWVMTYESISLDGACRSPSVPLPRNLTGLHSITLNFWDQISYAAVRRTTARIVFSEYLRPMCLRPIEADNLNDLISPNWS